MPSKEDWRLRFEESAEDKAAKEAAEKVARVTTEEMASLQNHPGWVRLKNHQESHRASFEKELADLKRAAVLVLAEQDIRAIQLKHAYRQGYLDGMTTVMNGPDDLSKPVAV